MYGEFVLGTYLIYLNLRLHGQLNWSGNARLHLWVFVIIKSTIINQIDQRIADFRMSLVIYLKIWIVENLRKDCRYDLIKFL